MDKARLDAIRARCEDCGLEYPFPDYVLPDDVWKRIAPKPDGNGLLCPTCIAKRLDAIDLWYNDGYYKPGGYSVFNPLQSEIVRLTTDRDTWRRRAECLESRLASMTAERDALIASLRNNDKCETCIHSLSDGCSAIRNGWRCRYVHPSEEWRGPEVEKE